MKVHTIYPDILFQRGNMLNYAEDLKFDMLTKHNIQCVVGMACDEDEGFRNLLGSNYLWYPIPDNKIKNAEALMFIAKQACTIHKRTGGAILTYCRAGRNRSGLMSALVLNQLFGYDGEMAIDTVRRGRPNALANEHFVTYLKTLPCLL